ncbi:head GIN domain-containing protein [candidate division KSB1 bacterium]
MISRVLLTAFLALLIIFNVSCFVNINDVIDSGTDNAEIIHASGVLTTRELSLADFRSVEISTAGTVNITYGTEQEAIITVDDNIFEHLTISVRNRILRIDVKSGYQVRNMDLTLDLTMTDIEELRTNSAGSFIGQNKFTADNVRLETNSAGRIELELDADILTTRINSAGYVKLAGSVRNHNAVVNSAGSLLAFDMLSNFAEISLNSVGRAEVYVTGSLNVNITSIGSLYYKGWPVISRHVTGAGGIIDAN